MAIDLDQIREKLARKVLRRCIQHPSWVPITGPWGHGRQCTECGYQERVSGVVAQPDK